MKKTYLALMLGMALTFSSVSAMAAEATDTASTEIAEVTAADEESTIYGEVKVLDENSITITTGTLKTEGLSSDNAVSEAADGALEEPESESAEAVKDSAAADVPGSEVLELGEEEQTVLITEDTLFYREKGAPVVVIKESGEDAGDTSELSDAADEQQEKPAEEAGDAAPEENGEPEENAEELVTDLSGMEEPEREEISFADLSEGDVLRVTLDEDGNAVSVTVLLTEQETAEDIVLEEDAETAEE